MPEKFSSESEKRVSRAESDTELIREGASLVYDEGKDNPRIEVTEEQIEEARKEMEEYFAVVEKEREINLKAAIEVEKTFNDLLRAVQEKDAKKINRSIADLIVMIKETQGAIKSPDTDILDMGNSGWFDINGMLKRLSSWMHGSEIPVSGWEKGKPKLLNVSDVLSDNDNLLALDVRRVLKLMTAPGGCLQVKHRDGKINCPGCEYHHLLFP
jgi:hypothetical protein